MVNKMKYLIEMECEIEGEVAKLREVANQAIEGAEVNITDIEGVSNVVVNVTAKRLIEEEVDLSEEDTQY